KQYVRTDIPQDRLVDFVELLPNLSTDNFSTLRITLDYEINAPPGHIRWLDIDQIREDAQVLMRDPVAAREALGLDDLDATCDQTFDPVQEPGGTTIRSERRFDQITPSRRELPAVRRRDDDVRHLPGRPRTG